MRTECRLDDVDTSPMFFFVTGADRSTVESALTSDHTVQNYDSIAGRNGRYTYRIRQDDDTETITPQAAELGVQFLEAESDHEGWRIRLQAADRETLSRFHGECQGRGIEFYVERVSPGDVAPWGRSMLTDEQRETLLSAYEKGYFDVPRTATQEELASALGISGSAVSQRIRRAVAQLVSNTLDEEWR